MGLSNGSAALANDVFGLSSPSQTGFPLKTPLPLRRPDSVFHVLSSLISDYKSSHILAKPCIDTTEMGMLLSELTRCWKEFSRLVDEPTTPPVVEEVVDRFRTIPRVLDVRVVKATSESVAQLSIIIDMPTYDDTLMRKLVNTEIEANRLLRDHNYSLRFDYLPWPYIEPPVSDDDLDLDKY